MQDAIRFVLKVVAGALLGAAAGLAADAVVGTEGWWLWGMCAGAIAGALISFLGEHENVES